MQPYPLSMAPYFRRGEETPWGGALLRGAFGKPAPDGPVGESLEISALPGRESVVRNGELAGKSLSEVLALWGEALTGQPGGEFPLLLKLLDAREPLSVQVHPGDGYALEHEGKPGKSEAWVVLSAEPGATLCCGLRDGAPPLDRLAESGEIENWLNWVDARPGDVFYLPNGTVHALGAGLVCYEIQQPSDATYRIWDWGRVGADGKPRALHVEKALDVSVANRKSPKARGATELVSGGSATHYILDQHFQLSRLNVSGTMPLDPGRMLLLTPIAPMRLSWAGGALDLGPFESALVPAGTDGAALEGDGWVLCSSLPDRERLQRGLGSRIADVAGEI